jgi:type IX secretion system PorP/SprF family membrane protein
MKYIWLILFCLSVCSGSKAQYTPVYSQYMFNGLAINPAYAGSREALSINALYRSQWSGFDGAPHTSTFSIHTPLKNEKVALGLLIYHDKFGVTDQTAMLGSYAYRIKMGNGKLSMGLQGGVIFQQYNWNNINTIQQNDQAFSGSYKLTLPSTGTGIYYYSEKYFAGISLPQLMVFNSSSAFDRKSVRYKTYFFTAGYNFILNSNIKIKPSFLLKYEKVSLAQLDLNSWLTYKDKIGIGLSYRSSDALVFLLSFQASRQFSIGYSYDKSFNRLSSYNNGSQEIVMTYDFKYIVKAISPRSF